MSDSTPAERSTTVLLVDDEVSTRNALSELLRDEGYVVRTAGDAFKALGLLDGWEPQILLTDVQMPGMGGVALMERVRQQYPRIATVVMTAFGSVDNAVLAMQAGADAYMVKPVQFAELRLVLDRLHDQWSLREENEHLKEAIDQREVEEIGWVGESRPARELIELLRRVADSDAPVVVQGERGAGKEFVTRVVHRWSRVEQGPMVVVRCRSLEDAMEARELFGDGEPSGGQLAQARGGTLLLSDVEELSRASQARLLEVLRRQADAEPPTRVRVVASTRLDLQQEVEEGRFREDLYYHLNVLRVEVPSLRQRRDDIPQLALHFAKRHAAKNHKYIRGFTTRALGALRAHPWPGNVRQLEAAVQRAVMNARRRDIEPKDLPRDIMQATPSGEPPQVPGASMAELERYAILQTLQHVGGSTKEAAKVLGVSTRKVQYRMSEYRDEAPTGEGEGGGEDS